MGMIGAAEVLVARRRRLATPNGIAPGTFLVDGMVHGTWAITRARASATLTISPFRPLTRQDTDALTEEGAGLLRFHAADAESHEIRVNPPD